MASKISQAPEGAPLTVCVYDCPVDRGQPYRDLAPVCFRLGCAFAEARWRTVLTNNADLAHLIHIEIDHARPALHPR
jgi:hypothetical protein